MTAPSKVSFSLVDIYWLCEIHQDGGQFFTDMALRQSAQGGTNTLRLVR